MTLLKFPSRKWKIFKRGNALNQLNKKSYLSTEDVAREFGFSVRTITAWAAEWHESGGQQGLPAFKMGRSWRFERTEIQAYIDGKKLPVQPVKRRAALA